MARRKKTGPDAVNGFLFADPSGGELVTGPMHCCGCEWEGQRTYNPRLPELELCPNPRCKRALLRPVRRITH